MTAYMLPARYNVRRHRRVHIVQVPGAAKALCGKTVRDWWKTTGIGAGLLCKMCQRANYSDADAQAPPDIDTDTAALARSLLDKIGYRLKLSPRQYQICNAMKTHGIARPTEIAEYVGISNRAVTAHLSQLCTRNGICSADLRLILPHVVLTDPATKRHKPTVYRRDSTWEALYMRGGKRVLIGYWNTEQDAIAGWRAYVAGRPFPIPPNKKGDKPIIRKQGNRWQALLYDKATKRAIYICACASYDEALVAWQHARQHGVYTKNGIVRAAP